MNLTPLIDVDSLREMLGGSRGPAAASRTVLLDCRFDLAAPAAGRQAYLEGHIPGARFADLNYDLAAPVSPNSGRHPLPAPDILAERFASLGIGNDTRVIAYDDANGSIAARAWWLLRWLGAAHAAVLDGGFRAWVASGGGLESGEPNDEFATRTIRFTPAAKTESVATSMEVLQAVRESRRLVVDARAAERFAGKSEPLDAVAGHVPGAINHPFTENLQPDGRFLPAAELRRRWQERLAGTAPSDAVLMCGSGVTACHNLLAMELAGLPGAKLYAGSWSEWIRDRERPVARGGEP